MGSLCQDEKNAVSWEGVHRVRVMSSEVIRQRGNEAGISFQEAEKRLLGELRPHIELKRNGRIEEVGAAVAYLASEAASFITGTNLRVDGGSVASI